MNTEQSLTDNTQLFVDPVYGWQMGGLGPKWIGCVITHLSIYDPFIYKLIIHYQPNLFN